MVVDSNPVAVTKSLYKALGPSEEFLDVHAKL